MPEGEKEGLVARPLWGSQALAGLPQHSPRACARAAGGARSNRRHIARTVFLPAPLGATSL